MPCNAKNVMPLSNGLLNSIGIRFGIRFAQLRLLGDHTASGATGGVRGWGLADRATTGGHV